MNLTLNDSAIDFNLNSDVIIYKLNAVTGGAEPEPPPGIEYLTDESGITITDELGTELTPE